MRGERTGNFVFGDDTNRPLFVRHSSRMTAAAAAPNEKAVWNLFFSFRLPLCRFVVVVVWFSHEIASNQTSNVQNGGASNRCRGNCHSIWSLFPSTFFSANNFRVEIAAAKKNRTNRRRKIEFTWHCTETRHDETTRHDANVWCGARTKASKHTCRWCVSVRFSFSRHRHFCNVRLAIVFVHLSVRDTQTQARTHTDANTSNWLPMELRAYYYLTSTFNHCCEWCCTCVLLSLLQFRRLFQSVIKSEWFTTSKATQ